MGYVYLRTQDNDNEECSIVLKKYGNSSLISQAIQKAMRLKQDDFLPIIISCSFYFAVNCTDEDFENYIKDLHEAREFNIKYIKNESDNT